MPIILGEDHWQLNTALLTQRERNIGDTTEGRIQWMLGIPLLKRFVGAELLIRSAPGKLTSYEFTATHPLRDPSQVMRMLLGANDDARLRDVARTIIGEGKR